MTHADIQHVSPTFFNLFSFFFKELVLPFADFRVRTDCMHISEGSYDIVYISLFENCVNIISFSLLCKGCLHVVGNFNVEII